MKRIKQSNKKQGSLYAEHYIDDRLVANDKVYLFDELVDQLDLDDLISSYGEKGGSLFNPRDMFAVILWGYFEGVVSAYQIHDKVQTDLRFIYLAGSLKISRRAISDFRIRNLNFLKTVFNSTLTIAKKSGLINSENIFAIDGSKFEANASMNKTASKEDWKKYQNQILEHVDKYLKEVEKSDLKDLKETEDPEKEKAEFEKIKERIENLNLKKKKKEKLINPRKVKEAKEAKKKSKKKVDPIESNDDAQGLLDLYDKIEEACENNDRPNYINISDSDCRLMKSDRTSKESYNVQIISTNQVITAMAVTQDEADQHQLIPMVNQLKENLSSIKIEDRIILLGDAGYNAGYNLDFLSKENNIESFISMYQRKSEKNKSLYDEHPQFKKENFKWRESLNQWICPMGEPLIYKKVTQDNKTKVQHFHGDLSSCIYCSKRDKCLQTKADRMRGYRTIEDRFILHRKAMKDKMQLDESKINYRKRCAEVEPVFGQIKANKRFKRFSLVSLIKVQGEFTLVAIAQNLRKILKVKELATC